LLDTWTITKRHKKLANGKGSFVKTLDFVLQIIHIPMLFLSWAAGDALMTKPPN
jgi:hypothetical protein